MLLQVKEIYKSFQRTKVLKGVSFSMERGQVLSIIGSSGSGKTTLLRCLNFLETPDAGQIILDGETLYNNEKPGQMSDVELRRKRLHFGLVFQQFHLFPQYTALRNITLAPELLMREQHPASEHAHRREEIEQHARELLARIGLADKMDSYPYQLSGGQQQRVAIARALALSPDILCFDEPTSALDPGLTGEVVAVLQSLKESGTTMIVVTHEMSFASRVADYILYMEDGIIEEEGTPEQVIGSPRSEKTRAFLRADTAAQ